MENLRLFAGFDGGGSKTVCALCNEEGTLLGTGRGGASNYRYCAEETARQSMRDALAQAFAAAGLSAQPLDTAYVSSAAIRTYDGERYVPFFSTCVDSKRLVCEGDIYPIWYGTCSENPAIVLIAGTGSIAYLFRGREVVRAGGWGPQVGDEGSGYDIGASAMRCVLRMYDHRQEVDTPFLKTVLQHYGIDQPTQLIGIANCGRAEIASCAEKVCMLAENGNPTAQVIINEAATELASLVEAVLSADGTKEALPLVLSGGLLHRESVLVRALREKFSNTCIHLACVECAEASPAVVCAALALKEAGFKAASDRLIRTARRTEKC